jgi:hypothetical protein
MSVLPADIHAELAQLLDALQSSDNQVRSQAEEHLANNWTATKPEMLLMGLVEQIQGSNDATVGLYDWRNLSCWGGSKLTHLIRHDLLLQLSFGESHPNLAS